MRRMLLGVAVAGFSGFSLVSDLWAQQRSGQSRRQAAADDWAAAEYSGSRSVQDVQVAMASKGFAWLSGSPADNEKLSIGKNAQFFGFVALRLESGRAANRGALGRAFFDVASVEQRETLAEAVRRETPLLEKWWQSRDRLLGLYENHLYLGEDLDRDSLYAAGIEFSRLGATVAVIEAKAFAKLEDSLTETQWDQLRAWRKDPEQTKSRAAGIRVTAEGFDRSENKQLEDLFAKAFSWLTGTPEDNEVIPLGQPAQFFGFVSIRHKSGHAASRGRISKSFQAILSSRQRAELQQAARDQEPIVRRFLELRHLFLGQLATLRHAPDEFDGERVWELADEMGVAEAEAGRIEAEAYRRIRASMTDRQLEAMMQLRGDYIVDPSEVELLTDRERGARLVLLCAGCHGPAGDYRAGLLAPNLDGMFDRPIASLRGFEFSDSLRQFGKQHGSEWTDELLEQYIANPKRLVPGTKMEFQGLLDAKDRSVLIDFLRQTR